MPIPAAAGATSATSSPRSTTARARACCASTPTLNQKTAIQFLDYVLQPLPFQVEVIQTDNGAEFQSAFHVLDKGIAHTHTKPRTPRLNGKAERSHRIDAEEFYKMLDGVLIDDANAFNDKLREWEDYYNYCESSGGWSGTGWQGWRRSPRPGVFDKVLADAGIAVVLTGIRMPRMNAVMERWVRTCRRELLDRTLIWSQAHLPHALREFESHDNDHSPHRALRRAAPPHTVPEPITGQARNIELHVRRHDRLGGALHEYEHAALTSTDE